MDSDFQQQQYSHHFQGLPKQQMNSGNGGLTRYRSAPSSYFSSFIDSAENSSIAGEFSPSQPRPLSPETQSILARFMENVGDDGGSGSNSRPNKLYDIPENSPVVQPQFTGSVKQETEQMNYQRNQTNSNSIGTDFRVSSSVGVDFSSSQMKMHIGSSGKSNSNLVRHRSSPAGLFDDIIIEDGYLVNRETGTGNYGSRGSARSNNQINFSTGENRTVSGNSEGVSGSQNDGFMTGFAVGAWETDDDFNSPENQNREGRNRPPGLLAHHLSLPKASIEKLLEFQETVPCKLRAKRGFATHPRSIAERVRRTKISERMRKLQDLVPNMDKQTNTADMLDLAVDYIKELQEQVKALTDKRDKCSCTS